MVNLCTVTADQFRKSGGRKVGFLMSAWRGRDDLAVTNSPRRI